VERRDTGALVRGDDLIAGLKLVLQEVAIHFKIFIVVAQAFNPVHIVDQFLWDI
jgi:hypothetical protein